MRRTFTLLLLLVTPLTLPAQMDHSAHGAAQSAVGAPTHAGQEAFATISEIVGVLKADPKTDWNRVDIEALRQHLLDMDDVVMRAQAAQSKVAAGLEIDVTGTGRVKDAIRRMVIAHAPMLDALPDYSAMATEIPEGARLTVIARNRNDGDVVARIRALGFMGLMTEGAHHQMHHLAIAKGEGEAAHRH